MKKRHKSLSQQVKKIKVVNSPVADEASINAHIASLDAQMQSTQTAMQKAQTELAALLAAQAALSNQLNSMNEMSEMTSMKLQTAMDRSSKFSDALSNIMKQMDSTAETIIQNLK